MATGDRILPRVEQDYTAFTEQDGTQQNGAKLMAEHVIIDSGSITPETASTASTPSIASTATALAANSARKEFVIQNLGTNPLYVLFGAGASTTVFSVVLKPGIANDDGNGGALSDNLWVGIVSIAGTSPRYTATELS